MVQEIYNKNIWVKGLGHFRQFGVAIAERVGHSKRLYFFFIILLFFFCSHNIQTLIIIYIYSILNRYKWGQEITFWWAGSFGRWAQEPQGPKSANRQWVTTKPFKTLYQRENHCTPISFPLKTQLLSSPRESSQSKNIQTLDRSPYRSISVKDRKNASHYSRKSL